MTDHKYDRPWQVMPAKIIKLALEYAQKDDDLDHQVAYLLLDIGVETALKVYLINKKQDVERIGFHDLLKKVKDELRTSSSNLVREIDDVSYFHGVRNKLYHQGDGIKPTEDNLRRYSELAKKVVEQVLEVNLETEVSEPVVDIKRHTYTFDDLRNAIEVRFRYFQDCCGIVTEKIHPIYGTREFAMKLDYINREWQDRDADDLQRRLEVRSQRVEKFRELTGKKQASHALVDFVLDDVKHLYVIDALKETSDEWKTDWNKYVDFVERQPRLIERWKTELRTGRLTNEQVREEFKEIVLWIEAMQTSLDDWISSHMENIYKRERLTDMMEWYEFLEG